MLKIYVDAGIDLDVLTKCFFTITIATNKFNYILNTNENNLESK